MLDPQLIWTVVNSYNPFQQGATYAQEALSVPSPVRPGFTFCCNPLRGQIVLLQTVLWIVSLAKSSQDKSVCTRVTEIPRIPQDGQS